MGIDLFRYDGKHVLVVGGATGMGGATVDLLIDLGARVTVMDYAVVTRQDVSAIHVDLRDESNIDAALAQVQGPLDALFMCAGVADGAPGIERVQFIGQRHVIEHAVREGWLEPGAAIGVISSIGGLGWERKLDELIAYVETPDFDSAVAWAAQHPQYANYTGSKMAFQAYVARRARALLRQGIRINCIMPGATDTPLAQANPDTWLTFGKDYRDDLGIAISTPQEQAYPLVFLCSDAARQVSGASLIVDGGYVASVQSGTWDAPGITMMLNR